MVCLGVESMICSIAVYHPRPPDLAALPVPGSQFPDVRLSENTSTPAVRALSPLRVEYVNADLTALLAEPDVLAVIGFGASAPLEDDPRCLRIGLEPALNGRFEVWRGHAPVRRGRDGAVRWSSDGDYLFFAIDVDETASGSLEDAAAQAYQEIGSLLDTHRVRTGSPAHVLRLWNYMDAINEGDGDTERYRRFCAGRAHGIGPAARNGYSAATAIGRRDGIRVLQVYGLAARLAGVAVENPRQLSAWSYPRQYGPVAPTFARATRTPANQLLVSGTAAVVGHSSQHVGDTLAQLDETLLNLTSLFDAAGTEIAERGFAASLLKVYLRNPADAAQVERRLHERACGLPAPLVLVGDICRNDLRLEIDGIQG